MTCFSRLYLEIDSGNMVYKRYEVGSHYRAFDRGQAQTARKIKHHLTQKRFWIGWPKEKAHLDGKHSQYYLFIYLGSFHFEVYFMVLKA